MKFSILASTLRSFLDCILSTSSGEALIRIHKPHTMIIPQQAGGIKLALSCIVMDEAHTVMCAAGLTKMALSGFDAEASMSFGLDLKKVMKFVKEIDSKQHIKFESVGSKIRISSGNLSMTLSTLVGLQELKYPNVNLRASINVDTKGLNTFARALTPKDKLAGKGINSMDVNVHPDRGISITERDSKDPYEYEHEPTDSSIVEEVQTMICSTNLKPALKHVRGKAVNICTGNNLPLEIQSKLTDALGNEIGMVNWMIAPMVME